MLSVEEINRLESENKMLRDSLSLANNIVNKYHVIIQEIKKIAVRAFAKQQEYKKDFGEIIGIIANVEGE